MTDQIDGYAATAEAVHTGARRAAPLLAGFNTCVDELHHLDGGKLDALGDAAGAHGDATGALGALTVELLARISSGRDGEVFVPDPSLAPGLSALLGEPEKRQVGGTGAQAAWALAKLSAPSVMALADRSAAQLSVLDPAIGLAVGPEVRAVRDVVPAGETTKPPHFIVEYTAGTRWRGGTVPRSSRIIVRLACDGLEIDDAFAALGPIAAGAGLVSGMNGLAADDIASHEWLTGVLTRWQEYAVPMVHLELAEYPRAGDLARMLGRYGRYVHSLGLSLAELSDLHPGADPVRAARAVAEHYGLDRVCVHADEWSLAVHRGQPGVQVAALRTANLLAAARARAGAPTADLSISPAAVLTTDLPPAGPLGDGWRADVVPVPYLARPAATVGLGDTFVAGLLLSACMPTAAA